MRRYSNYRTFTFTFSFTSIDITFVNLTVRPTVLLIYCVSHGSARGSAVDQLNEPRALCVDASKRVWVADCWNNRVKVLGVDLNNAQELQLYAADQRPLSGPTCLCLSNVKDALLYVGQRSGKVLVFQVIQSEL